MKTFLLLFSGGILTSLAEFFLNYNLIDLLKDKILGFFGKGEAAVKAEVTTLKKKL